MRIQSSFNDGIKQWFIRGYFDKFTCEIGSQVIRDTNKR